MIYLVLWMLVAPMGVGDPTNPPEPPPVRHWMMEELPTGWWAAWLCILAVKR